MLLVAGIAALGGCATVGPQPTLDQRRAAEVNAELGINYLQRGNLAQAERALDRALEFDSGLALAHLGLASLREIQGFEDIAITHYRKALRLAPADPYVQTNLGHLLCSRGEYGEGQALLQRAIGNLSYSSREVALLNSGLCYLRQGDMARAEERMRMALQVSPANPQVLYELAHLTLLDGRPLQTRAFLSRLWSQGIRTPGTLMLCYRSEMLLGSQVDARHCADELKRDFGGSAEAAELLRMEHGGG